MRAEIISVGTELLLGDIVNTNAQYLAQELATLGFTVHHQSVVGDNHSRLRAAVQEAKDRSEVLVFSGGLGPTEDDLTKETVAEVFGDVLVPDAEELERLESFFKKLGRTMTDNNRKQAMVPQRGQKLFNAVGTAPGAYFRQGTRYAFLLPGPPREMKPMFENEVRPMLEGLQEGAIRSVTLRVFGIGESELEVKLGDLLLGSNPTAALYAKTSEVHVRVTARASTAQQADLLCGEYADLIRQVLGETVYSTDGADLETVVVDTLAAKGDSIALAESCTGGLLAERITSVPGASKVFGYGAVTYANEVKHRALGVRGGTLRRWGAVSSQVAAEMAFGAARAGRADIGVGITGVAGPGGGTREKPVGLVYIGVALGERVWVRRINIPGRDRDYVRVAATQNALDMVRRLALGLPVPNAKEFTRSQVADVEREGRPRRRGGFVARIALAVLAVAAAIALLMGGLYYSRQGGGVFGAALPSAAHSYGSEGYDEAAMALVRAEQAENPAVVGFVALSDGSVEELVGRAASEDLAAAQQLPGMRNLAATQPANAPAAPGANTLVLGSKAMRAILGYRDTSGEAPAETFTYYSDSDARIYKVFAVLEVDTAERREDGFDPAVPQLNSYHDMLTFVLGARGRSLYAFDVDAGSQDSFMALAVDDAAQSQRRFYVLGRQLRPGEEAASAPATPAASPLMPLADYPETGRRPPEFAPLYTEWMREYLASGMDNATLQLQAGLPHEDRAPLTAVPLRGGSTAADEAEPDEEAPADAADAGSTPAASAADGSAAASAAGSAAASASPARAGGGGAGLRLLGAEAPAFTTSQVDAASSSSAAPSYTLVSPSSEAGSEAASSSSGSEATSSASSPASGDVSSSASQAASSSSTLPASLRTASSKPAAASGAAGSGAQSEAASDVPQPEPEPPQVRYERQDPGFLTVRMNGVLRRDTCANILADVVQAEMPGAPAAAQQAQAVALHSWLRNQQGAGNPAPSVRGRSASGTVKQAVSEVADLVLSADGDAPAATVWHALAADATNAARDFWGTPRSYLESAPSPADSGVEGWRSFIEVPVEEMAALLGASLAADPAAYGEAHSWFQNEERNEGGYVVTLSICGEKVSGLDAWTRVLVRDGEPLLPSPAFEVEATADTFVFTVYGRGHGVGMSQQGAAYMAAQGSTWEEIVNQYYPGLTAMAW